MGRWLKRAARLVDKVADKVTDKLPDAIGDQLQSVLADADYGPALATVQDIARRTECSARDTMEICASTQSKREQMIAFADEILATLQAMPGHDASILDTIKDLTDGEKVLAAKELASGLDVAALECVKKSTEMIDAMDEGVDSLPQILQDMIDQDDDDDDDGIDTSLLQDVEKDLGDVKQCITSILELNLVTGLQVGLEAFTTLADKARRSRSLFDEVHNFASQIAGITQAYHEMQVADVVANAK